MNGWVVATYFAIIVVLLSVIFSINRECLLIGLDGTAWVIGFDIQQMAREPFTQSGVDPLQGQFDAYFPAFREFSMPNLLAMVFTGGGGAGKVATYTIYAALMIVATYAMARAVGFSRGIGLLGGALLAVTALPTNLTGFSWTYGIYNLAPHLAQPVALTSIIIACFWALERRSWTAMLGLGVTAVAAVMLAIASLVLMTALMVPAIAFYAGGSLLAGASWRQNLPRVATAAACLLVPAALGAISYVKSLAGYTAFEFFGSEFEQTRSSMMFASLGYHRDMFGPAIVTFGLLGAVYAALSGPRRIRIFAGLHIGVTLIFQAAAFLIVQFATHYQGPSPLYFELMLWPIMLLFSAVAISAVCWHLASALRSQMKWSIARSDLAITSCLLAAVIFAIGAWNTAAAMSRRTTICSGFFPIQSSPITDVLRDNIALQPGSEFRGLVATFTGIEGKPSVDWFDLHPHDMALWQATGNDHRTVGLWWYRIPTLFQYSPLIAPAYYLLLTDFLSRPADRQVRSVLVLTQPNERMLKLWGVRYVITDSSVDLGRPIIEVPVTGKRPLRLLDLGATNLGDYSPSEAVRVRDFREGLRVMHLAGFDGRRTVVANDEIEGPLTPATNIKLTYQKSGFSIQALSSGRSLLVLPVQYSRCWTVSGKGDPKLIRTNLMQLGISFEGALDASLAFRFGPVLASQCRIEDIRDMERLRIREARAPRGENRMAPQ
jgi:hypothetical protein